MSLKLAPKAGTCPCFRSVCSAELGSRGISFSSLSLKWQKEHWVRSMFSTLRFYFWKLVKAKKNQTWGLYWFSTAAIAKCREQGVTHNKNLFSHSSGARSPKSRVQLSWFLLGGSEQSVNLFGVSLLGAARNPWWPWLMEA